MSPDYDEDMLELRPDVGNEGESSWLLKNKQCKDAQQCRRWFGILAFIQQTGGTYLKDYGYNIVSYMPLSWQLLSEKQRNKLNKNLKVPKEMEIL